MKNFFKSAKNLIILFFLVAMGLLSIPVAILLLDPSNKIANAKSGCQAWTNILVALPNIYTKPFGPIDDFIENKQINVINLFDPWNRSYFVLVHDDGEMETIKVISFGMDGVYGTADDISESIERRIKKDN